MSIPHHLSGRFGKPRGWRRRVMLIILLLGLSLLSGYVWLTRPQRLARLTSEQLTNLIGADVTVDSARISLDGTIYLGRVVFRVPGLTGDAGRLFEAYEVEMKHDLVGLFQGKFVPRSLTFTNPTLYLTEIPEQGKFNYDFLRQATNREPRKLPDSLPELYIRGGRMMFGELQGSQYVAMGSLNLSGNLLTEPSEPHSYSYTLRQEQAGQAGPKLSGQLNLETLFVHGQVEHFSFQGPQRNILPRELRVWWDRFDPAGSFPTVRFGYDPVPGNAKGRGQFNAELVLKDVTLTLPFLGEAKPRILCTSGKFQIQNQTVRVIDLTGKIEDFNYVINGQIEGFNATAPVSLSARLSGLVPDQPHYVPWLPNKVQEAFRRFTPTGKIDAIVRLEHKEPGSPYKYAGTVSISDARLLDARFPYPLTNLGGQFSFDDEHLEIRSLHGEGPTGGKAIVTGTISPLGPEAQVDLSVHAVNLPIDQVLIEAMSPKVRRVFEYVFNEQAYAQLAADEGGLIVSSAQLTKGRAALESLKADQRRLAKAELRDVEALAQIQARIAQLEAQVQRPVFDLGGKVKGVVTLHRPAGPDREFEIAAEIELAGATLLLKAWPYPLLVTEGKVRIESDKVELSDAHVQGLTGAVGTVAGGYFRDDKDLRRRLSPKISFIAANLPLDALAISALPAEAARWTRSLHLEGVVDATGKVFRDDDGWQSFALSAQMAGGSLQPWGGQYKINQVHAAATVTRYDLKIADATGKHGDTDFNFAGRFSWKPDDLGRHLPQGEITIGGHKINLADPVLDLVQPRVEGLARVRALFAAHNPAGLCDADLVYQFRTGRPDNYRLEVRPATLELDVRKQRIKLRDLQGSLVLTPGKLTIAGAQASFGDNGRFNASGQITTGEHPTFDIAFDAHNRAIDAYTRAFLPSGVVETIDNLTLAGSYAVSDAHLRIEPVEDHDPNKPRIAFAGVVSLENATAVVGLPVAELTGQMRLAVTRDPKDDRPALDMLFDAQRVRFSDRFLSPVSFHAHTDEETHSHLLIENILGRCYGGDVVADGMVDLAAPHKFKINVTVQNAALDPFTSPRKHDPLLASAKARSEEQRDEKATLSAELSLTSQADRTNVRRGRGRFEIRDASIFRVPTMHAIMHLLNLSLPTSTHFDQVQSRFIVEGNTITFENIEFDAPTLVVYGEGEMAYDTQALDLTLSIRNPGSPDLGPVTELLKAFKDELVHIHIGGTLDQPKATLRSFPIIKRGWRDLFGGVQHQIDRVNPLASSPQR